MIGIDEISIRKGHVYRIVVRDLERGEPLWFGGFDRSEESMTIFYDFVGASRTQRMRLAVMDKWKPFRNVTEAIDQVRMANGYKRLTTRPDRT